MQIGALGDIHGAFDDGSGHHGAARRTCRSGCQVGDVASNDGEYFTPLAPLYWIKGNNEDFDVIAAAIGRPAAGADAALPAATAGRTWSGRGASRRSAARSRRAGTTRPPAALPPSRGRRSGGTAIKLGKSRDDKRRHFVRDEVLACKALDEHRSVPDARGAAAVLSGRAAASTPARPRINDVLAAMRPRLHLFGHHHEFTDSVRQGVRSIGLDVVTKSYLLIDARDVQVRAAGHVNLVIWSW